MRTETALNHDLAREPEVLYRYWVTFLTNGQVSFLNLGCGVTAENRHEAKSMIREKIFPVFGEREFDVFIENVDVRSLDPGHVIPNMGNPASHGIWFPAL